MLILRQSAPLSLRQLIPKKTVLLRQQALLPKHTALTPRELDLLSPRAPQTSRQPNSPSNPWGSPWDNSLENPNPKWVINLSREHLTQAQRSVLPKGPNFVVTPRHPPNLEYIMAIKAACTKLSQQDAEELRAEINTVLWSSQPKLNHKLWGNLKGTGTA